jgi:Uma2 family endonuclease
MTLAALPEPKLMSIEQFLALPESNGYELVEGRLVERKTMGALSDYVAQQISRRLGNFCEERGAGHVFGSETTYRSFGHPDTGRRGDVSFIARGRLPGEAIPEIYIEIPADVVVEVLSPNDLAYEVEEKVELYLGHGFGEVWVVYPNTQTMHVHRRGEATVKLGSADVLKGRGPLAGFECPVNQFFPPAHA